MRIVIAFIFIALTGFLVFKASSSATAQSMEGTSAPIVIELFTSQSCSSCPPADRLLGALAENENIIALSCHVTYWNHLHWKDTLSQDFCTQRQRQYTRSLKSRGPYTPQMVINGHHDVVGNRANQVNDVVGSAAVKDIILPIKMSVTGETIQVILPQTNLNSSITLTLFAFDDKHTQSIPSGENRGSTVDYTNPVSNIAALGKWNGEAQTIEFKNHKDSGGFAVLAQDKNGYGKIIAAGQLKL